MEKIFNSVMLKRAYNQIRFKNNKDIQLEYRIEKDAIDWIII